MDISNALGAGLQSAGEVLGAYGASQSLGDFRAQKASLEEVRRNQEREAQMASLMEQVLKNSTSDKYDPNLDKDLRKLSLLDPQRAMMFSQSTLLADQGAKQALAQSYEQALNALSSGDGIAALNILNDVVQTKAAANVPVQQEIEVLKRLGSGDEEQTMEAFELLNGYVNLAYRTGILKKEKPERIKASDITEGGQIVEKVGDEYVATDIAGMKPPEMSTETQMRQDLLHAQILDLNERINASRDAREVKELERQKEEVKAKQAKELMIFDMEDNISQIANAIQMADKVMSSGFIGKMSEAIPDTPAYQLKEMLKPIVSNVALRKLMEVKASGATLGQVTEKELDLLINSIRSFDIGVGADQLKDNLMHIQSRFNRVLSLLKADGVSLNGESGAAHERKSVNFEELF